MKSFLSISGFFALLLTSQVSASFLDKVERMKWGDLDVVWIEDNKFPKFMASFYFEEGALADPFSGVTQATFDQLTAGTSRESQREIAEFFDFYGTNLRHSVTHEYAVFSVQALTKDIAPVMGKVCEVFNEAQYPLDELNSYVSRAKSGLKNLVTSHTALADRVFRNLSLQGTAYADPVEGRLETFDKIKPEILKERLNRLNQTKKTLYLAGPKDVMNIRSVITKKCSWKNEIRQSPVITTKPQAQSAIYLVPVSGANQAQIRIGRYLNGEELKGKHDQFHFLAGFLGGGFTSKLVQELRVKRGLTYSAGAYVSLQRDYGRAGINTFSKSETAADAIAIIREILSDLSRTSQVDPNEFKHQQGHQIGAHAFGFEATNAFLSQIMLYDHQKRNLQELANFPDRIKALTPAELAQADYEAFPWERLTIVVVGDKSLVKSLSRIRPVRVVNYEDFL
jgi:zinc protease